jgi:predicted DCC family thiol-disulfide oxidoreductase YuxK
MYKICTFDFMTPNHLVIFDGVCNLCNGTVQFIIRHDKKKRFSFASNQSDAGQKVLEQAGFAAMSQSSVVYVRHGVAHVKSKAALLILKDLGCCWNFFYILIVVPAFVRDFIYDLIAKNRYRIFGRRESCMVPTRETD